MKNSGDNGANKGYTSIGLHKATKTKLDKNRAPGQCYDGFICQLVDLWERHNIEEGRMSYPAGSAGQTA